MRLPLLAIGLGVLVLASGCGSENKALIPQENADQLVSLVQDAGSASSSGDCDSARDSVQEAQLELNGLPRRTDADLKQNISDWLDHLDREIEQNCGKDEEPTPTPTPSPTETPTPTATPEPGTGGEPAPEQPDGTGGVGAEDG